MMEWIPVILFALAIVVFGMSALRNSGEVFEEDEALNSEDERAA